MERVQLEAMIRKEAGKGPARRLRREGLLPAVVYGPRMDPLPVALKPTEVRRALAAGENVLVDLKVRGGRRIQKHLVMVKTYDVHPLKDALWHLDLYEVSLEEAIQVEVPLAFTGEAPGGKAGGILSALIRAVEISCLPEEIPEQIEVDCSELDIGDTLHVSDLHVSEEIKVITDPTTALVTVSPPEVEEVEEVEVEAAEEVEAEQAPSREEVEE